MKFFLAFEPRDVIFRSWNPEFDLKTPLKPKPQYVWQVYKPAPLDGILVSKPKIDSKKVMNRLLREGIHRYLDYHAIIFGDCGAFTYVSKDDPPYNPIEVLAYYDLCGFDYGATVDHLIFPAFFSQKEKRYEVTLRNAELMFREWDGKYRNGLTLVGVAQGWDVQTYCDAVKRLVEIGFSYVAIGSLARRPSRFILELVRSIDSMLKDMGSKIKLHLFGVGRINLVDDLAKFRVTSFDTATILRQAWLRQREGYYLEGETYTAIRIRPEEKAGGELLQKLRLYDNGKLSLEEAMSEIRKIENREEWLSLYERTLREKPWTRCGCKLCEELGIDIAVFRGSERNMRRGFHNVWQFYKALKQHLANVAN